MIQMSTFRRNPYRVSIWAILAVSGCTPCLAGDWYPGIVHAHTQFSDGVASPEVLATAVRAAGARFLIVTDHYDMIEKQEKWGTPFSLSLMDIAHNRGGPWGFDKYSGGILSLTRDGEFVAIPGAEIGARWEPEPGNEASAHTLALGVFTEADSQVLDEYCEKPGGQQHIIDKIRQWGMLPVAAHPSFLHDGRSGKLSLGGRIDYRYDKRPAVQYKGLAGVEMWNVDASDQHQTDIDFYMQLIREGYRPFVTSGCDYHGYKPWEPELFRRKTWVYADSLTVDGILTAIREGRTYAADQGVKLVSMTPMPGEYVGTKHIHFRAVIRFPAPTTSPVPVTVYRDGTHLIDGEDLLLPAGRVEYDVSFNEDGTYIGYSYPSSEANQRVSTSGTCSEANGDRGYVVRVGDVLVTSPFHASTDVARVFDAVDAGATQELRECLRLNPHLVNAFDGYITPLHRAAVLGSVPVVGVLLAAGADVNARNKEEYVGGDTPLHEAAAAGHADVVEILIARGADPNATDMTARTPLHGAVRWGQREAVMSLLAAGADANPRDEFERTPLDESIREESRDVASLLVSHGARPTLNYAAYIGDTELLRRLLREGAKVNRQYAGWMPLHAAVAGGQRAAADFLLANGAKTDARGAGGTPLHLAAGKGYLDLVRLLLGHGAAVDACDDERERPLHKAAWGGHTEIARLLLEAGADVNARTNGDVTAMHWAARGGHLEVVELLLSHGADISVKGFWRCFGTPEQTAAEHGQDEIARILRETAGH